jgi:glyoxylase-like metal-dependent hydrolase (beta-lactamase superfamily II)
MKGMAAVQIAGVYELAIANTKVFVIQAQKNVLVDTGSAPLHDEVMAFLEKTGFAFESEEQKKLMQEGAGETILRFLRERKLAIDAILCTHCHGDHTGNLKELKEYLQVPVAVHELDIPVVEGREQPAAPSFIPPEIIQHLKIKPCAVEHSLQDGEFFCEDLQVIHVPGHTPGSICLLYKNHALVAGDCLVGKSTGFPAPGPDALNPPMKMYSKDYDQALKSLHKLLICDFDALLPSHGASLWAGGKEQLKNMLQKQ